MSLFVFRKQCTDGAFVALHCIALHACIALHCTVLLAVARYLDSSGYIDYVLLPVFFPLYVAADMHQLAHRAYGCTSAGILEIQ